MPDNQKNKKTGKKYQQKVNRYQQEAAEELTKDRQKPNQYQQEIAQDFLNTKQANKKRSGYIIPDMDEEAGMEFNTDKIKKTDRKDTKKKS